MAVYDDEKTKDDQLREITGIDKAEEKAMEARAHDDQGYPSNESIAAAESEAASPAPSRVEAAEAKMNNFIYSGLEKKGLKGKAVSKLLGRRQLIGGGIISTIIGLCLFVFTIAQGPLALIHVAQLLSRFHFFNNSSLMDSRAGKLIKWKTTQANPVKRNMSFFGNLVADHYERRLTSSGIETEYQNRRLRRLSIDPNTTAGKKTLATLRERGVPFDDTPTNGRINVVLDGSARQRRYIISGMINGLEINGMSSAVAKRVLKVRAAVDFHPLKNVVRGIDEDINTYREKVRSEREERRRNGVKAYGEEIRSGEADTDGDGEVSDEERAAQTEKERVANEAGEISNEARGEGTIDERTNRVRGRLGNATAGRTAGVMGVVALTCGVYEMIDLIPEIRDENIVRPMMRIGAETVSVGSQIQTLDKEMDLNNDEIGTYYSDLYDEESGTHFIEAQSIQHELGNELTGPDLPEGSKPGFKLPAFFQTIKDMVEALPGGSATCAVVSSTVGGFIIDGASWAISATGPFGFLLNASTDIAAGLIANQFIGDLIRVLAGEQIESTPTGALLGNIANYGERLAANETMIAMGGRVLNPADTAKLDQERDYIHNQKIKNMSVLEKYASINNPDSLVAKTIFETSTFQNPRSAVGNLASAPMNLLSMVSRSFTNNKLSAQSGSSYSYGFPEFGFTIDEIENEDYDDPYANADIVEENLEELNETYGEACFGTTIDPTTFQINPGSETKGYHDIDEELCSDPNNQELLRYRFYLADMFTVKSLACLEDLDEQSCSEIGLHSVAPSGNEQASGTNPGGMIIGDPYTDTTEVPCAPGTNDIGIQDGYIRGNMFRVRLCSLPNLPSTGQADTPGGAYSTPGAQGFAIVNSRVSGAWYQLIQDALADGINFTANSSFRSMTHQEALWEQYGRNPSRVARPGDSPHQAGTAIDFNNMQGYVEGAGCSNKATNSGAGYQWLVENAGKYGFKQYAAEAWHWDPLPAANRC